MISSGTNAFIQIRSILTAWRMPMVLPASLLGFLVLQILLCAYPLVRYPFWLDEAFSALMARKSLWEIHHALRYDAGPPLYYDLLHGWRLVLGESEWALRSFSLVCSLGTTVVLFHLCRRFFYSDMAPVVCGVWVLSPLQIYYATEARNYTLFSFLMVGYLYTVLLYSRQKRFSLACGITLWMTGLLYTHNLSLFILPAAALQLLLIKDRGRRLGWAAAHGTAVLFYLPWLPVLQHQIRQSELTTGWIQAFWSEKMLLYSFTAFIPGGYTLPYLDGVALDGWVQGIVYAGYIVLCLYSLSQMIRHRQRLLGWIVLYLLIALLLPYGYSWLFAPAYLAGRTDFFVYPLWCVLIGYGLWRIPNQTGFRAAMTLVLGTMLIVNVMTVLQPKPFHEGELIKALRYHARPGDVLLCTGLSRPIVEWAVNETPVTILSYPEDMQHHLAHLNEQWYRERLDLEAEADKVIQHAFAAADGNKILLIWSDRAINQPLMGILEQQAPALHEYRHPKMGLRKLNEPISLWIIPTHDE